MGAMILDTKYLVVIKFDDSKNRSRIFGKKDRLNPDEMSGLFSNR